MCCLNKKIHKLSIELLIAKVSGYDSELIREQAKQLGMEAMIPKRSNTKKPDIHFKKNIYKSRHLVENLFARLKHFRSISTRFDKLSRIF